jgi:hypothetical protein
MPLAIVPDSFVVLLGAFRGCFGGPSFALFRGVVAGWVHCLGRRTLTAVALAGGLVGTRHVSGVHRFFARAVWRWDELGRVLFALAVARVPAGAPLLVLLDDTLARKGGKGIALAAMHHDPLRSTARKRVFSFGHVWVVAALWVPLPGTGGRGVALPVLARLATGGKQGGPTKPELARELVGLLAGWAPERTLYVVADTLYGCGALLDDRPPNVHMVGRLRMDAALWAPPPPRRPGQPGRPRKRGPRLPSPQALADARRAWHRLPVTLYGRAVTALVCRRTALWYNALPGAPVRVVLVRDPRGRRRDEAFLCTDLRARAAFVLETYARRWTLEVCFHDAKQHLGLEDPQNRAPAAVRRTAPTALLVYALVLLWYAGRPRTGRATDWLRRPWYPRKTAPSFADMLAALRRDAWHRHLSPPTRRRRRPQNPALAWADALLATA